MSTAACKAAIVAAYPNTKIKDWKRESYFKGGLLTARMFSNKVTGQEVMTREYHSDGRITVDPHKRQVPPPSGMPTAAEIASGRTKIIW